MATKSKISEKESNAHTELTVTIRAQPRKVWKALITDTSRWWPKEFFANPDSKGMVIEPRVGGRMFEDAGDGAGVLWGIINVFDPPRGLDIVGFLSPAFGGPATTMIQITLQESGLGTLLQLSDHTWGPIAPGLKKSLLEGWRALIADSLAPFVETASAK